MEPDLSVYCPCTQSNENNNSGDPSIPSELNNNYKAEELFFCDHCNTIRCQKCTELDHVAKYCPQCLTITANDYNFCPRNCFDCPLCSANLSIAAEKNKSFLFKCTNCPYRYSTGSIGKNKKLSSFIKAQIQNSEYFARFSQLQTLGLQSRQEKDPHLYKELVNRLTVNKYTFDLDIKEFNEADDICNTTQTQAEGRPGFKQSLKSQAQSELQQQYPISKKLRSRKSLKCKACRNTILKPSLNESGSFKFEKQLYAVDFLPSITIKEFPKYVNNLASGETCKYILVFKNPLIKNDMKVTVSTLDEQHTLHNFRVSIPCNNFVLQKLESILPSEVRKQKLPLENVLSEIHSVKNFIKTIPTIDLTRNSKLSTNELKKRVSKSSFWSKVNDENSSFVSDVSHMDTSSIGVPSGSLSRLKFSQVSLPNTTAPYIAANNISKSFNTSQDSIMERYNTSVASAKLASISFFENDEPLDSDKTWCCIAMSVTLSTNSSRYTLNVPLFVSVEVGGNDVESSFGYWINLRLGEVA